MTDKKDQTLDDVRDEKAAAEHPFTEGTPREIASTYKGAVKMLDGFTKRDRDIYKKGFDEGVTAAESRQAKKDEAAKDLIEIFEECFNSIHAYGITKKSIVISTEIQRAVKAITVYEESLK